MTSTVAYMTHSVSKEIIHKLFVKFSNKYGSLWSSRLGDNGNWQLCEDDWHQELSVFTLTQLLAAVKKALIIYTDYPPTQGQLIALCLLESGVPSLNEVIQAMIKRDFSHPVVKMVYDKVGSWTLSNGKEGEVQSKAASFYDFAVAEFKQNPDSAWKLLKQETQQTQEFIESDKKPTEKQKITWRERLAEYHRAAEQEKSKLKDQKHPEFDEKRVNPNNIHFDKEIYNEYKKYLLSVSDHLAISLPHQYAYDRFKFIGQIETAKHLNECGHYGSTNYSEKAQPRSHNEPMRPYKSWTEG